MDNLIKKYIASHILINDCIKLKDIRNTFELSNYLLNKFISNYKDLFCKDGHYCYRGNKFDPNDYNIQDAMKIVFCNQIPILEAVNKDQVNIEAISVISKAINKNLAICLTYCGTKTREISNKFYQPVEVKQRNDEWILLAYSFSANSYRNILLRNIIRAELTSHKSVEIEPRKKVIVKITSKFGNILQDSQLLQGGRIIEVYEDEIFYLKQSLMSDMDDLYVDNYKVDIKT